MSDCFLKRYGSCGGKISGEHYISKTVLEAISPNGITQIGGLPWQTPQTLQSIGIGSLVSNILCETHNSALSKFDSAAGTFFRALDSADKRPQELAPLTAVVGPLIERWFLKVVCGLVAGPGFNNRLVPEEWKSVLSGTEWPDGWGLYVPAPSGPQVLATEFSVETVVNPCTKSILAAVFRVAGVSFNVLFGHPDNPAAWGTYRPRGLIFRNGQTEKRIEFVWPFSTVQAVIYTKVGATKDSPPQWNDWKE